MKLHAALATAAAGILSLALVAPATAAVDFNSAVTEPTIAPAGPGDNGQPEDTGKPENPGQPDEPGTSGQDRPDSVGPSNRDLPDLPDNASPKAQAAVTAAYEQFIAIADRIAAIRELEPGADRNAALNEVFVEFGGMIHSVSDAVHAVEAQDEDDGAEGEGAEITLAGEDDADGDADTGGDGDSEGDTDADADEDEDKKKDKDNDSNSDDEDEDPDEDADNDDDQDDEDPDDED